MKASALSSGCDKIISWDVDHYQSYGLFTDGVCYLANDAPQFSSKIPATRVFSMGEGFWFVAKNALNWSESNPYIDNL